MAVFTSLQRSVLGMLSPSGRNARLIILMFHQVLERKDPVFPDVPDGRFFDKQMSWLAEYCNVIPLYEAALRLQDGTLPSRAACITFDDGYADNLEIAAPILSKHRLPATFFITGGAVEEGIMWNDLVIEAMRRGTGETDLRDLELGMFDLSSDAARRAAIDQVLAKLKYQELAERQSVAERIHSLITGSAPPRLMMTVDQVEEIANKGFEVGAHTINHPILKNLEADVARAEICLSRDWVHDVTGRVPMSFAYPNGRPGVDYDESHEVMGRDAGFGVAVSTRWSCANAPDSLFGLPRISAGESSRNAYWLRLAKTTVKSYF